MVLEVLAVKGAILVGHTAGPHLVAGASAGAAHLASAAAEIHTHAAAAGLHPAVVAATKAAHAKAAGVAHGLSTRATHAATRKALTEVAKRNAGTGVSRALLMRPPLIHQNVAGAGMGTTGASGALSPAATLARDVAASLAAKALIDRTLETDAAGRLMDRTRNSPTTRKLMASARQNTAGKTMLGHLQRTQLGAALLDR